MNAKFYSLVIIPVLIALCNLLFATELPEEAIREGSRLLHNNGKLERAYLVEPVEINGIEFEGWSWFDSTGSLNHSDLAEDHPLGEIILPKGSTVFFNSDIIEHVWLEHDMDIDGLPVDGGGKIDTGFHPDGSLRFCFLRKSLPVQGVMARGGTMTPVEFDENGKLTCCTLAADYENNGTVWHAGTEIWLNEDGSVRQSYRPSWFARMGRCLLDVVF